MTILNMREALALFVKTMECPDTLVKRNIGPARIVFSDGEDHLVMFKRDYYKNFGKHFQGVKKENGKTYGWGQIMSASLLDTACNNCGWVVFITPDGKIYRCRPLLFKKFVQKYGTEVPHLKGEVAMPLDYFERVGGVNEQNMGRETGKRTGTKTISDYV